MENTIFSNVVLIGTTIFLQIYLISFARKLFVMQRVSKRILQMAVLGIIAANCFWATYAIDNLLRDSGFFQNSSMVVLVLFVFSAMTLSRWPNIIRLFLNPEE